MSLTRLAAAAALAALTLLPSYVLAAEVIDLTPPRLMPDAPATDLPKDDGAAESSASMVSEPAPEEHSNSSYGSSDDYGVDAQPMLQTRHFGPQVELACGVARSPHGLLLENRGHEPLPAGTRIKWQIKSAGLVGYFAIIGPLEPGETLVADDVVGGNPDRGAPCVARAI